MLLSTEAFEALVKVSTTKKAIASDSRSSKLQRLHLQFQPQRKTNFCRLSLLNLPSACTLQTVKDFLLAKWKSHKLQQRLSPIKFPTTLSSNGESFSSLSHTATKYHNRNGKVSHGMAGGRRRRQSMKHEASAV